MGGYSFVGWFSEAGAGDNVDMDEDMEVDRDQHRAHRPEKAEEMTVEIERCIET